MGSLQSIQRKGFSPDLKYLTNKQEIKYISTFQERPRIYKKYLKIPLNYK